MDTFKKKKNRCPIFIYLLNSVYYIYWSVHSRNVSKEKESPGRDWTCIPLLYGMLVSSGLLCCLSMKDFTVSKAFFFFSERKGKKNKTKTISKRDIYIYISISFSPKWWVEDVYVDREDFGINLTILRLNSNMLNCEKIIYLKTIPWELVNLKNRKPITINTGDKKSDLVTNSLYNQLFFNNIRITFTLLYINWNLPNFAIRMSKLYDILDRKWKFPFNLSLQYSYLFIT